MRIRFEFKIEGRIRLADSWPVDVDGTLFSFREGKDEVESICATLFGQPTSLSPDAMFSDKKKEIKLRHGILLPELIRRLESMQCSIGLIASININVDEYEVFFEPENATEESEIKIKSWRTGRRRTPSPISFDIVAKGLLCAAWPENERKGAEFFHRGYRYLLDGYYVDSFVNYYFFLERLYAVGKFKKEAVVKAFSAEVSLVNCFNSIEEKAKASAKENKIPIESGSLKFFEWIVGRRGFFQHQSEKDPTRWLHST